MSQKPATNQASLSDWEEEDENFSESQESPGVPGSLSNASNANDPQGSITAAELYPAEVIKEMKQLGLDKPADCPWPIWLFSGEPSHIHDLIVMYAAHGWNQKQICAELGRTQPWMSQVLNHPEIKNEIRLKQDELFGQDVRKRISTLLHKSVDVMDEVISNSQEKTSLKLQAAQYLLDQGIGKAKQDLSVEGSLLANFIARLDQDERARTATATAPEKLVSSDNPIDNFVDTQVQTYKVGAKKNG